MKKRKILGCVAVVAAAVVSKLIEDDNKDWSVLV